MVALVIIPGFRVTDSDGDLVAGAQLYAYLTGTLTPVQLYLDNAMTTPATNPVIANASGTFPDIYANVTPIRVELKDALGAEIADVDPYTSGGLVLAANTYTRPAIGAVTRPLLNKIGEIFSVKDFGAIGDGVNDDTAEIQAALTAAGSGSFIYFPAGTYLLSGQLNALSNQHIYGDGPNATILNRTTDYGHTISYVDAGAGSIWGMWFKHGALPAPGSTVLANRVTTVTAHVNILNEQGWTMEDCWLWRMPYGVRIQAGAKFSINRCSMQGVWDDVNVLMQEGDSSVYVGATSGTQLGQITNCNFAGSPSAARNITWTSTDTGAHVVAVGGANIGSKYGVRVTRCEGLLIQGNYFGGNNQSNIAGTLIAGVTAIEWRILDNFFDGAGTQSAIIAISSTDDNTLVNGVIISGNHFNGEQLAYQAIQVVNASGGGVKPTMTNFTITNNTFTAMVGSCITLYNARGGVIGHNSFTGYNSRTITAGGDVNFACAVWTSANTTNILCDGNILGGTINGDSAPSTSYKGIVTSNGSVYERNTIWNGVGVSGAQVGKKDLVVVNIGNSNYTMLGNEDLILVNNTASAIQIFPPTLTPPEGWRVTVKDSGNIAATRSTSFIGTIDGAVNLVMNTNNFSKTIAFGGGSAYYVIGN